MFKCLNLRGVIGSEQVNVRSKSARISRIQGASHNQTSVLKVKKQAAIVQIDGANGSKTVVYHKVFGVDKAGGILINLYSRIQQRGIVARVTSKT